MIGAILGDMIGSPYEFSPFKKKRFPLFIGASGFTDDTVMTIAVAEALMQAGPEAEDEQVRNALIQSMQSWGRAFPDAGYGGSFFGWLFSQKPQPYNSYGNGSAMRVSPAGWLYDSLEKTRHMARLTAEVTHNHPEGIKGAEATASAIWLARTTGDKDAIYKYVTREFGYDLDRTCDEIRPRYHFDVTCQGSVPEAIIAFMDSGSFEEAVRLAVSLGGDSDTQGAIAGSIAEAYYGVDEALCQEARRRIDPKMTSVLDRFEQARASARPGRTSE